MYVSLMLRYNANRILNKKTFIVKWKWSNSSTVYPLHELKPANIYKSGIF